MPAMADSYYGINRKKIMQHGDANVRTCITALYNNIRCFVAEIAFSLASVGSWGNQDGVSCGPAALKMNRLVTDYVVLRGYKWTSNHINERNNGIAKGLTGASGQLDSYR